MNIKDAIKYENGVWYRKEFIDAAGIVRKQKEIPGMFKPIKSLGMYARVYFNGLSLLAHRIVWEYFNGPIPNGSYIDHINGIRHDNRLENLRLVTSRGNSLNKIQHRNGKLVGGTYVKSRNKWVAQIRIKGKNKNLGYFDSELEAHEAYNKYVNDNNV